MGLILLDENVDVNIRDGIQGTFSKSPLLWVLERDDNIMIDLLKGRGNLFLYFLVEGIRNFRKNDRIGGHDYFCKVATIKISRTPIHGIEN